MDGKRFDAFTRLLGFAITRRGAGASIAALTGVGLPGIDASAKKKKKRKKKKPCKSIQLNCETEGQCCGALACQVVEGCPESLGGAKYCCGLAGETCTEGCDCCGDLFCQGSKCCGGFGENCASTNDCCERMTCQSGECTCGLVGEPCDVDEDCCLTRKCEGGICVPV